MSPDEQTDSLPLDTLLAQKQKTDQTRNLRKKRLMNMSWTSSWSECIGRTMSVIHPSPDVTCIIVKSARLRAPPQSPSSSVREAPLLLAQHHPRDTSDTSCPRRALGNKLDTSNTHETPLTLAIQAPRMRHL